MDFRSSCKANLSSLLPPQQIEPNEPSSITTSQLIDDCIDNCVSKCLSMQPQCTNDKFLPDWVLVLDESITNFSNHVPCTLTQYTLRPDCNNMKEMKKILGLLFHEISLHQHDEAACRAVNANHKKQMKDVNKVVVENCEKGLLAIEVSKTAIDELKSDIRDIQVMTERFQSIILTIEQERYCITGILKELEIKEDRHHKVLELIESERIAKRNLLVSEENIRSTIASLDEKFQSDNEVHAIIRSQHNFKISAEFWETSYHLKRRIFLLFRHRIYRQRKIKLFTYKRANKLHYELKRISFVMWKSVLRVFNIGKELKDTVESHCVQNSFRKWKILHVCEHGIKQKLLLVKRCKQKSALMTMHHIVKFCKQNHSKVRYQERLIEYCGMKRCFLAIKRASTWMHVACTYVNPMQSVTAWRHFKGIVFTEFRRVVARQCADMVVKALTVLNNSRSVKMEILFNGWKSLYKVFFYYNNRLTAIALNQYRNITHTMTYQQRIMRKAVIHFQRKVRRAFLWIRRYTQQRLVQVISYSSIKHKNTKKFLSKIYNRWKMVYNIKLSCYQQSTVAIHFYFHRKLSLVFKAWSDVVSSNKRIEELFVKQEDILGIAVAHNYHIPNRIQFHRCHFFDENIDDNDEKCDDDTVDHLHVLQVVHLSHTICRWKQWYSKRLKLRLLYSKVKQDMYSAVKRHTFSSILAVRSKLMSSRIALLSKDLLIDGPDTCNEVDILTNVLAGQRIHVTSMQKELDSLIVLHDNCNIRLDYFSVALLDVRASYSCMLGEKERLCIEIQKLRDTCDTILIAYEKSQETLSNLIDADSSCASSIEGESYNNLGDGKTVLLQDVEHCYSRALTVHNASLKQQGVISSSAYSAIQFSLECRSMIMNLNSRIEQLEVDRSHLGVLLAEYTNSLETSFLTVGKTTSKNDKSIAVLQSEKGNLQALLEISNEEERMLQRELDELQKEFDTLSVVEGIEAASILSMYELHAVDHHIYAKSFLETSTLIVGNNAVVSLDNKENISMTAHIDTRCSAKYSRTEDSITSRYPMQPSRIHALSERIANKIAPEHGLPMHQDVADYDEVAQRIKERFKSPVN